ncbi:ABC transporter permease subunit [Arthrobacter sp. CAN_C5]|uniref:ABC transporter permease n=1 Tax=Arthrobacter sp. CAN_C5 TaxID=2760706 RepID=UPI0028ABB778|nr:ABC transporter permease subunit [Arthrobacter sp. CAN_C5]MBP2215020.1 putative spermidine/putrescine transport system permease protein [Arthrobacter sp. CAN_C5]
MAARRRFGPMTGRRASTTGRAALLALLAVVPIVAVVGVSLTAAGLQSVGLMPFIGPPQLSADAWTSETGELIRSSVTSVYIAAVSTVLSLVVGFMLAAYVLAMHRMGRIVETLSAATIPIPHVIGAGAIGLLLSDSGFLERLLGMPDAFPALVSGPWFVAVIAEYAWKESAFVALVVLGSISRSVGDLCDAAATLGASAGQRIVRVVLPLAVPSLAVSAAIVFVYTLGSYEAAWLLGPTSPEPLPVRAVRLFTSVDLAARPQAMVTALVSVAVSVVVIITAVLVLRRHRSLR